jgi:hypothetical protein
MPPFIKTPVAARELGVTYHRLIGLLRFNKIPAPVRDSSGDYLWSPDDITRARQALQPRAKEVADAAC